MPKYKKAGKRITEDFVSSLFRAIGRGLSPVILKTLSKYLLLLTCLSSRFIR